MRNLKRALSLALASVMLLGMMVVGTGAASYPDVDSEDHLEAIGVLEMLDIMTGDDQGNFNPDKTVTRNEMAVIMCKLLGLTPGGSHPFTDVPDWASPYVAACYANGITGGTSATTYSGDDGVTTVQGALMLLKPLGYFQYQGEFGGNWETATIRRANQVDMFDDVNSTVYAPMTRNDVAQMVLNALEATMVMVTEEGGIQVDGNGMSVVVNPTYKYEDADDLTGINYNNANQQNGYNGYGTRELCEDLYGNALKKSIGQTDDFQRPAVVWTYKTKSVTAPEEPTLTYTAAVAGRDIYADMGRTNVAKGKVTAYIDGVQVTKAAVGTVGAIIDNQFAISANETSKIGGNGILTEVYYDQDTGSVDIVMVSNYAAVVNDVTENKNGGYDIDLVGESKVFNSNTTYAEETVVVYTKTITGNGITTYADAQAANTSEIKTMYEADMISGTVTRIKDEDSFELDGNPQAYAKMFNDEEPKLDASDVNYTTDVYLDADGNVVMLANVGAGTSYAVVVDTRSADWSKGDKEVKLLFTDGVVDIVTVSDKSDAIVLDGLYTYTRNSDDVYTLTLKDSMQDTDSDSNIDTDDDVATELSGEQGKATVTIAGQDYYANSKTEFLYYNRDTDSYSAWTGIANYPGFDNNKSVKYNYAVDGTANGTLKAVYISAASDVLEGSKTTSFIYVKGDEKVIIDADLGNFYELKAVVDGEVTTVMVAAEAYPASSVMVNKFNVNDDGVITSMTPVSYTKTDGTLYNGDGAIINRVISDIDVSRGNIIFTLGNGTVKEFVYSSDVKVYEYNTDEGAFYTKAITSLRDQSFARGKMFVQIDDAAVVTIYYVK